MANTHSIDLESSSSQFAFIDDVSQTGLDLTGDCTFEAWIKLEQLPSTKGSNMVILAKQNTNNTGSYAYRVNLDTANKLASTFWDASNNASANLTDSVFVSAGEWIHIAVVMDVSVPSITIYKNGTEVDSTMSTENATSIGDNAYRFQIGTTNSDGSALWFFDGLIDEVRVWNDVRTPEEISDNFEKELIGNETNLVGYWKFNNDALDTTSNNNDLTLLGSPSYSTDVPSWLSTLANFFLLF